MSEFTAIRAISQSLRELVESNIPLPGVTVALSTPSEFTGQGISIWLYRVTRNENLLNQPERRVTAGQRARRPLPVTLHYLFTPLMNDPLDEQLLLGRILQLFNDIPVLRGSDLRDSLAGEDEDFRIHLEMLTLEELTRVWGALQESYQTSLSYLVEVVEIDAGQEPESVTPVQTRETTYSQIVAADSPA
jgi:hypothetical protein